jgi:hypothetical protein
VEQFGSALGIVGWRGASASGKHQFRFTILHVKVVELVRAKPWICFGITFMSLGCAGGGLAGLRSPEWYEEVRRKVLDAFPIISGKIRSPNDGLCKRNEEGIGWRYPQPFA